MEKNVNIMFVEGVRDVFEKFLESGCGMGRLQANSWDLVGKEIFWVIGNFIRIPSHHRKREAIPCGVAPPFQRKPRAGFP
jgi:hypothetical protein